MSAPQPGMITALYFVGRCNDQRVLNTVHYRMDVVWTSGTIDQYYNDFNNEIKVLGVQDITTAFLNCLSPSYTLERRRLQVIYPVRFRGKDFSVSANGTRGTGTPCQNVAAVLHKQTELAGRSKQGSVRLGGIDVADVSGGYLVGGIFPLLTTLRARLQASVIQTGSTGLNTPVLYHPGANANPKYDYMTNMVTQETIRTQRSRTVGKGE